MKKIFVICSKAFYKDIPPIKEKLEENGWEVFLPHTYENPNAENEWYAKGKEEHARMKGKMFRKSRDMIKTEKRIMLVDQHFLNYMRLLWKIKRYTYGMKY